MSLCGRKTRFQAHSRPARRGASNGGLMQGPMAHEAPARHQPRSIELSVPLLPDPLALVLHPGRLTR